MKLETIYQEPEFTSWILEQTPDFIIDALSADKVDFHSISAKNKKNHKINNMMRKKKIISIAKNKKRVFDHQKMLVPCALFDWSILEDEPEDLTNIKEIIKELYKEKEVNDTQQLATQLYFVRAFEDAHALYLESKNTIEQPKAETSKITEPKQSVTTSAAPDKQLKKLSKEIEKKKEELTALRTKLNAEIKNLKESLNNKGTELFALKKLQKEQEDELKVYKAKYQEEVDQRLAKESQLTKAHFSALDKKDTKIDELEQQLRILKLKLETEVTPSENMTKSIPLIDTSVQTTVDESLISKLATTWKNKPNQEEGYSIVQQEERIFHTPIKRASSNEKLKVIILGNPRNSTVLSSHAYEMTVFENEQCEQFIQAVEDSQFVYLYAPRYLPEEFERLATAAVISKSIIIHSFADLKQTLGAL